MRAALLCIVLMLTTQIAAAIDTAPAFDDAAMQARYDRVIRNLRCVVCRSETIADSNAFLAADLRRQVRELMTAGKSDDEIFEYMKDRYSDYVLYTPPVSPRTWLLWAAPVLFVLMGGVAAGVLIVRKSRLPLNDSNDNSLSDNDLSETP